MFMSLSAAAGPVCSTSVLLCCWLQDKRLAPRRLLSQDITASAIDAILRSLRMRTVHNACLNGSMLAQQGIKWLDAVHQGSYNYVLISLHHASMAQCYQASISVHHASIIAQVASLICIIINMAQCCAHWLISLNLLCHTLSTSFFATLFAVHTWKKERK